MSELLNLHDMYIGDIAGIILIVTLFLGNFKRFQKKKQEYRSVCFLLGIVLLYCVDEIVTNLLDGCPGTGALILNMVLTSCLFAANMLLCYEWARFIAIHLGYETGRKANILFRLPIFIGFALLIVNAFYPLVFSLQENHYQTEKLYFIYEVIAGFYFCYCLYAYFICKRNGGVLKYFPVWLYILPSAAGMLLEGFLGSSLIGVCNGAAFGAVLSSLQDEMVFRDALTGLYNRSYLEDVRGKLEKQKNPYISGIMLDLNGFKKVNDTFGHSEGDQALVAAAGVIRTCAGSCGDVIRYAGDEFIVLLNTMDDAVLQDCLRRLKEGFETWNRTSGKPYRLSASMGYANFNANTQTVNEFLNTIDRNMYADKAEYYRTHCQKTKTEA